MLFQPTTRGKEWDRNAIAFERDKLANETLAHTQNFTQSAQPAVGRIELRSLASERWEIRICLH